MFKLKVFIPIVQINSTNKEKDGKSHNNLEAATVVRSIKCPTQPDPWVAVLNLLNLAFVFPVVSYVSGLLPFQSVTVGSDLWRMAPSFQGRSRGLHYCTWSVYCSSMQWNKTVMKYLNKSTLLKLILFLIN